MTIRRTRPMPLLLLGLLSSCSFDRADTARRARAQMVGMPAAEALRCMGAPDHRLAEGDTELWSYMSGNGQTDTYGDVSFSKRSADMWSTSRTRYCKVDVTVENHVVTSVRYSGPNGGLLTAGEQCAYAVRACVGD